MNSNYTDIPTVPSVPNIPGASVLITAIESHILV